MKTKCPDRRSPFAVVALLLSLLCSATIELYAATNSVTTLSDSGAGSLRAAIASAADGDTISFAVTGTVSVTTVGDSSYGPSSFMITNTVTIEGNGSVIARDSSVSNLRLFYISPTGNLTLKNTTLRDGRAVGGNGGSGAQRGGSAGGAAGLGGAIFTQGALDIESVTLTANQAVGGNGGGDFPAGGLGSGGGGGGLNANGGVGGDFTTGGDGGGPNGGTGGVNTSTGTDGDTGGGGGGGGSSFAGSGSGAGGAGGFGGGGGGGGAYDTAGNSGGTGGIGGDGGFGGGAGSGGAGSPDGTVGNPGFGGGGAANGNFDGNVGGVGGGGAGMGGAIFNDAGTVMIVNSTLAFNTAQGGTGGNYILSTGQSGLGLGGAVFNLNGTLSIQNATIAGNTADEGGGIHNFAGSDGTSEVLDYADPVNGELSQDEGAPTPIGTLGIGTNTVSGVNAFGSPDVGDVFQVDLPVGLAITSVSMEVLNYDNVGGQGVCSFFIPSPFDRFGQFVFSTNSVVPFSAGLPVTDAGAYGFSAQFAGLGGNNSYDLKWTIVVAPSASVVMDNTIVADSANGASDFADLAIDGGTTSTSGNDNLIENNDGFDGGLAITSDPGLGPLQDNGGYTPTMKPAALSPAIDGGNNGTSPSTDQRGENRPLDPFDIGEGVSDIGSVEVTQADVCSTDNVDEAIDSIHETVTDFDLIPGIAKSLDKALDKVSKALGKDDAPGAVKAVDKLLKKIEKWSGKQLTEEQADELTTQVVRLRAMILCATSA